MEGSWQLCGLMFFHRLFWILHLLVIDRALLLGAYIIIHGTKLLLFLCFVLKHNTLCTWLPLCLLIASIMSRPVQLWLDFNLRFNVLDVDNVVFTILGAENLTSCCWLVRQQSLLAWNSEAPSILARIAFLFSSCPQRLLSFYLLLISFILFLVFTILLSPNLHFYGLYWVQLSDSLYLIAPYFLLRHIYFPFARSFFVSFFFQGIQVVNTKIIGLWTAYWIFFCTWNCFGEFRKILNFFTQSVLLKSLISI